MPTVSGTLAITDPDITISHWTARAYQAKTGAFVGAAAIVANGATPVSYSIDCGTVTDELVVTMSPTLGRAWSAGLGILPGDVVTPSNAANQRLFRATTAPGYIDPFADYTVFVAPLESDFADGYGLVSEDEMSTEIDATDHPTTDGAGCAKFTLVPATRSTGLYWRDWNKEVFPTSVNDFTVDLWAKPTDSNGSAQTIIQFGDLLNDFGAFRMMYNGGNTWATLSTNNATNLFEYQLALNTWNHLAYSRKGPAIRWLVNGAVAGEESDFTDVGNVGRLYLGRQMDSAQQRFGGKIGGVRVTRGAARFWDAFTPPTIATRKHAPALTNATEPTWPATAGQTVNDGAIVWTCQGAVVQPLTQAPLRPVA